MLYEVITAHFAGIQLCHAITYIRREKPLEFKRPRAGFDLVDVSGPVLDRIFLALLACKRLAEEEVRITSYNVCYTKLLRDRVRAALRDGEARPPVGFA